MSCASAAHILDTRISSQRPVIVQYFERILPLWQGSWPNQRVANSQRRAAAWGGLDRLDLKLWTSCVEPTAIEDPQLVHELPIDIEQKYVHKRIYP